MTLRSINETISELKKLIYNIAVGILSITVIIVVGYYIIPWII